MKINLLQNRISRWGLSLIQGYSHEKYWKRRERVVSGKGFFLWRAYYLLWIKRVDAKHLSSFGTNWGKGASFASPPLLPHGPNGIIVGHDVSIGRNVTICQQVTIMHGGGGGNIGDNVLLGAGAKILPGVHIGDNAKIGANCVVVEDVPAGATCVLQKPRILVRK